MSPSLDLAGELSAGLFWVFASFSPVVHTAKTVSFFSLGGVGAGLCKRDKRWREAVMSGQNAGAKRVSPLWSVCVKGHTGPVWLRR